MRRPIMLMNKPSPFNVRYMKYAGFGNQLGKPRTLVPNFAPGPVPPGAGRVTRNGDIRVTSTGDIRVIDGS